MAGAEGAVPAARSPAPTGGLARAEALRVRMIFEAAGAESFETGVLQPAGPLLDLYGEDIRARAFTTTDPLAGERMLRPDFTVAVVRAHLARGGGAGRYAYAGEVFRRQEVPGRPTEYLQAGIEVFHEGEPAARDAEVVALVRDAGGAAMDMVTGDIGLLTAAVRGLRASERRRAALLRHVWRPERFRALLERFGRASARAVPADDAIAAAGPEIGERGAEEVALRLAALREDAAEPPIPAEQIEAVEVLLALRGTCEAAPEALRPAAAVLPALAPALDAFSRRLDALGARGIAPGSLAFEASLGRATMEYYDGFVFACAKGGRPVASGGRYDALTRRLGRAVPAVGAILRPAELLR
jgi:ATP phosphoribosyltransferase regulatory subunit